MAGQRAALPRAGESMQAGPVHEHRHRVVSDGDATTPPSAIVAMAPNRPFGGTTCFSGSFARLVTRRSVSSSVIRRRALTSSARSVLVKPGLTPRCT